MAHFVYPTANPMAQVAPTAQAAYQSAQSAYVAAPQPTAYATAPAPRTGQTYESYPSANPAVHPTTQYTYTRAQVAVTPTVTYDQSKTYYQPTPSASYAASDHQFQGAKPVFSTGATYANAPRQTAVAAPKAQGLPASSSGTSYVYSSNTPAVTTYSTSGYTSTTAAQSNMSGYDAALYSAASNYYSHHHPGKPGTASWMVKKTTGGGGGGGPPFKPKPKGPPKSVQLHYCDVCKISCGGPQSYRDHLEGQKHKKKEAALKATQPAGRGALQNQMRCELCDLTCTGKDSYAAHIRGAKHQKVVKLHTKLGKPIPSADPVVIPAETKAAKKSVVVQSATAAKKVLATPKINFVGGTQLKSTGSKAVEEKMDSSAAPGNDQSEAAASEDDAGEDVAPVGHEYIEEVVAESGKVISFSCKLCDCKFNDPYAKEIHLKGRRHRLQYKKKVDPNLLVKVKPKGGKQYQKEDYWRRQEMRDRKRDEMRMEDEIYWGHRRMEMMGGPMPPEFMDWHRFGPMGPMMRGPFPIPPMMRRPKSSDDKHVMAKHRDIYPTEEELRSVQSIVSSCERALKHVSDVLSESDAPANEAVKEETEKEDADSKMDEDSDKKEESSSNRALKGVMRVGVLAKGLLLHGDLNVNLVVLCSEKPTRTMLEQVADALPKQLANVTKDEYEVRRCVEEAAIIVSSSAEPTASCTITLTSPVMREANLSEGETVSTKDPPDVLDRQKCLDALAALRHAKWFQARANGLPSCVIIIRNLRDLRRRVPAWAPLSEWAMELLVEKTVSTGSSTMGPGEALRRVFECIASGILLPGGPGLYDPCEKEAYDVTATLTSQQREDITALAQNAMRLIAFHQMHKVLDMELLPMPRFLQKILSNRKRRHTNSTEEDGGEKKDRKESESPTPASTTSSTKA